jgi:hypothetical protein
MISSIKQKVIVGKAGKIELPETELPEGTQPNICKRSNLHLVAG